MKAFAPMRSTRSVSDSSPASNLDLAHFRFLSAPENPNAVSMRSQTDAYNQNTLRTISLRSFALALALGATWQVLAQDSETPYPSMAPLEQYLISDRNAEI